MAQTAVDTRPKHIDIDSIVSLADKGNTAKDIAKILGCSYQNILDRLERIDYNGLQTYRQEKDKCFERLQWEIAKTLTPEEIKRIQPRDRITSMAILEDKIRLIRGQATDISLNVDAVKIMDQRRKEIQERLARLEGPQDVVVEVVEQGNVRDNVTHDTDTQKKPQSLQGLSYNSDYVNLRNDVSQGKAQAGKATRRGRPRKGR